MAVVVVVRLSNDSERENLSQPSLLRKENMGECGVEGGAPTGQPVKIEPPERLHALLF